MIQDCLYESSGLDCNHTNNRPMVRLDYQLVSNTGGRRMCDLVFRVMQVVLFVTSDLVAQGVIRICSHRIHNM
jgi:hypothetical protein